MTLDTAGEFVLGIGGPGMSPTQGDSSYLLEIQPVGRRQEFARCIKRAGEPEAVASRRGPPRNTGKTATTGAASSAPGSAGKDRGWPLDPAPGAPRRSPWLDRSRQATDGVESSPLPRIDLGKRGGRVHNRLGTGAGIAALPRRVTPSILLGRPTTHEGIGGRSPAAQMTFLPANALRRHEDRR
jgi:hypothetical protein